MTMIWYVLTGLLAGVLVSELGIVRWAVKLLKR